MSKPLTDYIKVAQSGRCADGRVIQPEWLREMAKNYSQDVYTAMLWPEHMRWGNNWGEVASLEARDEEGKTVLYARLSPNASYAWERQYDQKLFYSIELNFEIMEDGSAYLEGLGVTDSPASLGMRPHRFSRGGEGPRLSFSSGIPAQKAEGQGSMPAWAKELYGKFENLFTRLSKFNEVAIMTPEEIQALLGALRAELKADISALESRLSALEPKVEEAQEAAAEAEETAQEAEEKAEEALDTAEEALELAELQEEFKKVKGELAKMRERFARAAPATPTPENTGQGQRKVY